jgi:hypothetical protein
MVRPKHVESGTPVEALAGAVACIILCLLAERRPSERVYS